jgi:hypothetical protein
VEINSKAIIIGMILTFISEKAFETQSNRATEQKQRIIQFKIRKSHCTILVMPVV